MECSCRRAFLMNLDTDSRKRLSDSLMGSAPVVIAVRFWYAALVRHSPLRYNFSILPSKAKKKREKRKLGGKAVAVS